jgi:predicted RNase H-like HicB family nuclease
VKPRWGLVLGGSHNPKVVAAATATSPRRVFDLGFGVERLRRSDWILEVAVGRDILMVKPETMNETRIQCCLHADRRWWIMAQVPELPGAVMQGRDMDEAGEMIQEAMERLLQSHTPHGKNS